MKNLHLLPTKKQIKNVGDLVKDQYGDIHIFTKNDGKEYGKTTTKLNIYITDRNYEFGEGWYFNTSIRVNKPVFVSIYGNKPSHLEKIVITNDQKLIKDNVQAIDDEFLEWIVKNPQCEEVDVKQGFPDGTAYGYNFLDYKIITK